MSRRKLMINLGVVLVCGIIACSISVIVHYVHKPAAVANANQTTKTLVSTFVGQDYQNLLDTPYVWQISVQQGDTVITTWDTIYQNATALNFDPRLTLTPYGLCYFPAADFTPDTWQSYVCYCGQTCTLTLPA